MQIKKSGNKIYGASFTAAEKKAIDKEIKRQLAEYNRNNATEIAALILWCLHENFGFGHDRLRRFHKHFTTGINDLGKRYEMNEPDEHIWLCKYKLKEYGIDIEEWSKKGGD